MKLKNRLALSLAALLVLSGCGNGAGSEMSAEIPVGSGEGAGNSATASVEITALNGDDIFSDRDFETDYDVSKSAVITLNGSSAQCDSDAVEIAGSTVTIKDEGTYILSGSLEDGRIVVDADKDDKTQVVLDGVSIHSETSAPIYIKQADKVFVTLVDGSKNSLSNGGSFVAIDDNEIDAAVFSKEDLTLNGEGALVISSPAGHGIVSKDELAVTGGSYEVTCASHGLSGKDGVGIAGGTFNVTSGKDGIHGENKDDSTLGYVYIQGGTFEIASVGDGVSAESTLQIDGGTFNIDAAEDGVHANGSVAVNGGVFAIATGDDGFHADETLAIAGGTIDISTSYEGLEGLHVVISGGEISLVASDDGVNAAGGMDSSGFGGHGGRNDAFGGRGGKHGGGMHGGGMQGGEPGNMGGTPGGSSNGSVTISGGNIYVKASGDGIDANGTLSITGGNTVVCGPNHGDTATLDYDTTAAITGGTFIGSGAMTMAQTFSDSEQGVISVNAGNMAAGTTITLADKNGNTVITHTPELNFSVVILSSPEIISGENYTLTVGSASTDFTAE